MHTAYLYLLPRYMHIHITTSVDGLFHDCISIGEAVHAEDLLISFFIPFLVQENTPQSRSFEYKQSSEQKNMSLA